MKPTFEEFCTALDTPKQSVITKLQAEVDYLTNKYNKLVNPPATYSDQLAKSFHLGKVGFMGGSGAKRMSRDLDKTINQAVLCNKVRQDLGWAELKLKSYTKGKIDEQGRIKTESIPRLQELVATCERMLKTPTKPMSAEDIEILKDVHKSYKKKLNTKIKKYTALYNAL